ncbi:MAG TPA: PSD1 and planctomycete cytochrome C domain-containing protein [Planctomycetota bacterium]|nr:PSD1 and planctomycete cytochrome C domain-containing protein [Planctomycetota bacterium]
MQANETHELCFRSVACNALLALLATVARAQSAPQPAGRGADYNRDIRPLLAEKCFPCHGFDERARKAGLRLDRAETAFATRDGVTPIVPRDLGSSEVWRRIRSQDADERMPPPDSRRTLSEPEQALIRDWIEQGARYAEHWAFVPPKRTSPPAAAPQPIDAFVRARLAEQGLSPAPEAERATLLRRAFLDLTGLPPSAEQVAAFVADPDPHAWENALDVLLASPHFGERLALEWLDAARYADTNGFSIDGGRHAWIWRDYVIAAFNANKRYDRFLLEQIAGDLLPDRTEETLVATGFQRNNMVTHEGGTIAEENLVTYSVDRVRTFGEAVLGITMACAQCHDHKFDPITQRDYYSLFAYFNTSSELALDGDGGVDPKPFVAAHSMLRTGEEGDLRARIAALEAEMAAPRREALALWEADERTKLAARGVDLALHRATLMRISTPNTGEGFLIEDGRFARIDRPRGFAAFDVAMELPPLDEPITGLRVVMHPRPDAPAAGWGHGGGRDGKRTFQLTTISVSSGPVSSDQVDLNRILPIRRITVSSWDPGGHPRGALTTDYNDGWMPDLSAEGPVHVTVTFDEPVSGEQARHFTVQLNFGRGGDLVAARSEFFAITGNDDGTDLPADIVAILGVDPAQRTDEQTARIAAHFAEFAEGMARTRIDLANARERLACRTEAFPTMVMDTAAKPRETFVLHRGLYSEPREKVAAATPAFLPPPPEGALANRLGLAQWVVMPDHPLTARVAVNRFWQMLFGTGLVRTAADFGTQGEWPSHPELLDWLAVEFVESGWNVKQLLRTVLLSATYRQSSVTTAEQLERDPDNRWLARGPRFRLPAELIRDAALRVSGLLVPQLGGPSVNPYTPGDPWREISHYASTHATAQSFVQDHGEKLWRRSLYTYWKRTMPPPSMVAFDAPNREVCTISRPVTNTPLQALVLLNDTQFVEAARGLAERILRRTARDDDRLTWAFQEVTSRVPDAKQLALLQRALARERSLFAARPDAAARLLANGEKPPDSSLEPAELAAWAQVAAILLNLSETDTRN